VLWAVFVVVAVVSGWVAVQMVGAAIAPASVSVLSTGEVSSRLATSTPVPQSSATDRPSDRPSDKPSDPAPTGSERPGSSPAPSTSEAPSSTVRTLVSRGGSVVASCSGTTVYLRSASPAVGYDFDEWNRGPAAEAEVRFSGDAGEVKMQVTCRADGVPTAKVETEAESGGDD
jgi:hypothetical protein